MEKQKIKEQLTALQLELDKLEDTAQAQSLQAKLAEIQSQFNAEDKQAEIEQVVEGEPESLADSFEDFLDHYASEFEADHPTVAGLLRDISTRLAAIGI